MILQPYVENALWHGLSYKTSDRKLELTIQKQNGHVIYEVKDNGVGRKKSAELKSLYRKGHKSKGMDLLNKRFKLLSDEFGSEIKTEVSDVMNNGEAGGTKVSIMVPDSLTRNFKNDLS
jgi:sensor histidine kinase YesM